MRIMALNLLKQEKTAKCGIKIKQHKAGTENIGNLDAVALALLVILARKGTQQSKIEEFAK
ncbi:MAG: hypothetical protein U9Q07_00700 [Planctomycetota bacterium]|nr:hypothetical protein [Planctomycetota bacterium]